MINSHSKKKNVLFEEINTKFVSFFKTVTVGIIGGLISGLFFALYSDLRPQLTNVKDLFRAITFVTVYYFILLAIIVYILIFLWTVMRWALFKKN